MPEGPGRGRAHRLLVGDHRCGLRAQFGRKGQRIGFERQEPAVRRDDLEFVSIPHRHAGQKNLPEALSAHAHRVPPAIPVVEISHHADAPCVGREDGEKHARNAVEHKGVRAQLIVEAHVRAFAQEIEIEIGQHGSEAIGVFQLDGDLAVDSAQTVARINAGQRSGKKSRLMQTLQPNLASFFRNQPKPATHPAGRRARPRRHPGHADQDIETDRDAAPR